MGALDMGGGSAEISFIANNEDVHKENSFNLTLYGIDYTLYSHSYLCYGFNEAHRRLMAHLVEVPSFSFSFKTKKKQLLWRRNMKLLPFLGNLCL